MKAVREACLVYRLKAHIAWLDQAVAKLDQDIQTLIVSAPGAGPLTAQILLALMPELGAIGAKRLAALAAFNPVTGPLKGKRCISGGRRRVRSALFIAALHAARRRPDLKAFAERMQSQGESRQIALTASARRLLTRLNAMLRDTTVYNAT